MTHPTPIALGRAVALSAACVLLPWLAGASSAQEAAPDAFEESLLQQRSFFDYGGFEPDLESILPKGKKTLWTLHAGVEGTYSDNVDKNQDEDAAFWSSAVLGAGWQRQSRRLTGSADYRYSTPLYRSDEVSSRDYANHRAAAALRWQAAEYLNLSGGGHFAQDLEGGLAVDVPGVPATYGNRSNQYGTHLAYDWRLGRSVTNRGSYRLSWVDYVADAADGQDTRRQNVSESLGMQLGGRDQLNLSYGYSCEEEVDTEYQRQDHSGQVGWSHRLLAFPARDESSLSTSYRYTRVKYNDDPSSDYWSHTVNAGYQFRPGPQTSVGVNGGYQWILPDADDDSSSWNAGADLEHAFGPRTTGSAQVSRHLVYRQEENGTRETISYRAGLQHQFGEYTHGQLQVAQSWEYLPVSSTSSTTTLTKNLRLSASMKSRLAERLNGSLQGGYLLADPDSRGGANGDYWQATAGVKLTSQWPPDTFFGAGYNFLRRVTDASVEDYRLHRFNIFCRRQLWDWLSGQLQYSHVTRKYDSATGETDYDENRLFATLTARW